MKDTWINFRSDQNTKERFEKLVLTTHKNKQELMNDLIDSYLLLNNDEYNSLDKKIAYMLELLNIINEYVQLPVKSYCKELPKDMTEIEKIVKAKSRYHLAIMNKINTQVCRPDSFLTQQIIYCRILFWTVLSF